MMAEEEDQFKGPIFGIRPLQPGGLHDSTDIRDACGVGFVVSIKGAASHKILKDAESMSKRMEHRGACACDNNSGDGAGVMTSIPHEFYKEALKNEMGIDIPDKGSYGTGIVFMDKNFKDTCQDIFNAFANKLGLKILCWRKIKTNNSSLGRLAVETEPLMRQVFVVSQEPLDQQQFKLKLFLLRKLSTKKITPKGYKFYICSLSTDLIVYKGQLTSDQVWSYFIDLQDPTFEAYFAIVHARFSTNTFPSWERAHPLRYLAHNGEINTLRGNKNHMKAREGIMESPYLSKEQLAQLYPVIEPDVSDSGSLDNVIEFLLHLGQWTLSESMMALVPEAWDTDPDMSAAKRDFYRWSGCLMEPWDGPALLVYTDGKQVGASLDRNGLRPARYYVTKDGHIIMASEVGVVDVPAENILFKGRLRPGRMIIIDTQEQTFKRDEEIKSGIASQKPLDNWLKEMFTLKELYDNTPNLTFPTIDPSECGDRKLALFGYSPETINLLLLPMLQTEKEALGSMGNDAPLACLSLYQPLVYDYFKQLFAQVTNPPIDPFREKIVMSLACPIGPEGNILEPKAGQCKRLWLEQPILSLNDMEVIKSTNYQNWKTEILDLTYPEKHGAKKLPLALEMLCGKALKAVRDEDCTCLVLSDLNAGKGKVPISAALAVGAVHQYLIQERVRLKVAIIVETGEAREVHHICVLLGYGADAICPHLVFKIGDTWSKRGLLSTPLTLEQIFKNYVEATSRGISKVMAKMGISTLHSYKGAQIFEAVGLNQDVIDRCFRGTASRLGGATLKIIAEESLERYRIAYTERDCDNLVLRNPGFYHWRSGGEKHINNPLGVSNLQEAVQTNSQDSYQKFLETAMENIRECTLRGQFDFVYGDAAIPLSEVEEAKDIVKRFVTGAMSLGSISIETHTTLAIAMNRIGGKSNTGEGGEDASRWESDDQNFNTRSSIKQVASGRFGVTIHYLANADEIQIKMAQGAKPGEGGELPGYKVTEEIAKQRHSIPGVGLISPPPHHDIYSIEDLAQLIYDLKCSNPKARISVKLVSEVGVGVVASGVAKGKAEHITISGHDGGTGASSWTGIKNSGLPWELGVAETHQALVQNDLRSRVVLQVDGQIRTGFDVVVAAILGGDEFGFSTAPLVALGCTMMRKCHLNTCPVGIATQDPELRKKFEGKPEHVVNFLFLIAEEVREIMSKLRIRRFQDLIGKTKFLKIAPNPQNPKARFLDFSKILLDSMYLRRERVNIIGGSNKPNFELESRLDTKLIKQTEEFLKTDDKNLDINLKICNTDRAFGCTLSYHLVKKFGPSGIPNKLIHIKGKGSAGQSFGAFLIKGVTLELEGDANDYLGKGLSGGEIVVYPDLELGNHFKSEENVIVGNVCLYGATTGKAFIRGIAAERFCVRNSGAMAVVEGVGDHGCEYMTGGTVVILGMTGRNFAAGMSGGIAYILNRSHKGFGTFESRCNHDLVDLMPLEEEEEIRFVQNLIIEFYQKTKSSMAEELLQDWTTSSKQFIKVFPREYQRALKELKAKQELPKEKIEEVKEKKVPSILKDIEDAVPDLGNLDRIRGFMKYKRESSQYRSVKDRIKDRDEIYNHKHTKKFLKVQAARCMDCGVPFCQSESGCPLGNIIPRWNELVFENDWKEALNQLLQTNNFPEFTGRICPAPCEGACVLGINELPVTIKNIECAIIEKGFEEGWMVPQIPTFRTGKMVAIIGSGPAGLAAAAQLNKAGHSVTVYEKNDKLGGLLRYGIPPMKLSKEIIDRRIKLMEQEGIVFKINQNVGKNIPSLDLLYEYDVILLAIGSTTPRDLQIKGRHLEGICFAMQYLEYDQKHNHQEPLEENNPLNAKGKNVIVIGGGDTGVDCMATALRQGAKSITTFEILSEPPEARSSANPWPQWPRILRHEYGHDEVKVKYGSDPRQYNVLSKEFLGDYKGRVTGIKTTRIRWTKSVTGHWEMDEKYESDRVFKADLVLLAMGFIGPDDSLLNSLDIEIDLRKSVETARGSYRSSVANIYAAGDCRIGQSLVVTAITEGRLAARQIDRDLMGYSALAGPGGVIPFTHKLSLD